LSGGVSYLQFLESQLASSALDHHVCTVGDLTCTMSCMKVVH